MRKKNAPGKASDHSPIFISGIYVLVSVLWIVFSDRAVALFAGDSVALRLQLQTIKGIAFVVATGAMLYLLVRSRITKIKVSEYRYRALFEAAGDGVLLLGPQGIIDCNLQALKLFGFTKKDEIIGLQPEDLSPRVQASGEKSKELMRRNADLVSTGAQTVFEWTHKRADGKVFDVSMSLSLVDEKDKTMVAILRDITELKQTQENLKRSLKEKEVLLDELYHRTKNNMQIISAFLDLQSLFSGNQQVKSITLDTQNRIRSMALAHEKLYQSGNLSSINMKEYISDLARLILQNSSVSSDDIGVDIDADNIVTLIDIAIPCGLVLTELITNSIKYAFPGDRKGLITIKLYRRQESGLELIYSDNGRGMPPEFNISNSSTFGIPLMIRIVETQLHGFATLKSRDNETKWTISMREDIYSERVSNV